MGKRRQSQDLNPETVKLTTRAETFEIHWGLAGDPVKTVGSGATFPDFQIQWAWGGLQDLMPPPDDSDGRGLEAHFARCFSVPASFAHLQKSPVKDIVAGAVYGYVDWAYPGCYSQGPKSQNGPKQVSSYSLENVLSSRLLFCLSCSTWMLYYFSLSFPKRRQQKSITEEVAPKTTRRIKKTYHLAPTCLLLFTETYPSPESFNLKTSGVSTTPPAFILHLVRFF